MIDSAAPTEADAPRRVGGFLLACAGLVAARMVVGAHAPSVVDAHVCLAALLLALVSRAPPAALVCAGLCVVSAVASLATSWDPWMSLLALPAAVGPAAFFLLASSGSCRSALLAGLVLGGALNGGAAIVQRVWLWPDALRRMDELGLDGVTVSRLAEARPLGMSVSPDLAGGLCLAGLIGAAALWVEITDRRARIAIVACAAASVAGLVAVRSFGTGIALVVAALVVVGVLTAGRAPRGNVRVAAVGGGVALFALGVAFSVRGADALARSAGERLGNWKAAIAAFEAAPVLGVGFMRFPAAYLAAREPGTNLTRYAHSTPLEHLAETGLVGTLLVIVAAAVAARAVWRRRASWSVIDTVLLGGTAAAAFRLLVDYDGHVAQTSSVAALLAGFLVAEGGVDEAKPAPPFQRRTLAVGAAAVLSLVIVLAWRQSALDAASEFHDEESLVTYSAILPFDVEPRLMRGALALDALDSCTGEDACASALRSALDSVEPLCQRAHPPSAAFILRARARLAAEDAAGALADVDAALRVDPGHSAAHQLAVGLARALGQDDAARVAAASTWGIAVPATGGP